MKLLYTGKSVVTHIVQKPAFMSRVLQHIPNGVSMTLWKMFLSILTM